MIKFNLEVFEVFEEYKKASSRETRLEVLQKYKEHWAFKDILRGSFDDSLVFNLPSGRPPFTPNKPESSPSTLRKQHKQFVKFIKGGSGENLPAFKRENQYVQLLESIHPEDAEYVLKMIAKKPPCRYITKKLVQEAYPNLLRA